MTGDRLRGPRQWLAWGQVSGSDGSGCGFPLFPRGSLLGFLPNQATLWGWGGEWGMGLSLSPGVMPSQRPQNPRHPGSRSLRVHLSRLASPSSPALLPVLDLSLAVLPRSTRMFSLLDGEKHLLAPAPAPVLSRMFCRGSSNFQEASACALMTWGQRNLQGQESGAGGRVPTEAEPWFFCFHFKPQEPKLKTTGSVLPHCPGSLPTQTVGLGGKKKRP